MAVREGPQILKFVDTATNREVEVEGVTRDQIDEETVGNTVR